MSYDIFSKYGLDKIHDSMIEDYDYKDNDSSSWTLVKQKQVPDSDGFMTDYCWYTNGDKHIFMFGDCDMYEPDEDYADWECDSEEEATSWFNNYNGFEDNSDMWQGFEEDDFDDTPKGNSNFINEGFNRVFNTKK